MPVPPVDQGPFLSLMDWVNNVGQIPLQAVRGRPGAAGRKALDVLGDIPDSLIPGDWIPGVGDEDPNVRPSELLGIDPATSPGIARATDIVGGAVTNPLTYAGLRGGTVKVGLPLTEGTAIPGVSSLVERGRDLVGQGVGMLPDTVREGARNTAAKVRRTLNWLDVPAEGEAITNQARGIGTQAAQVAGERVQQIYRGLTPAESEAVGEIAHGIRRQGTDRQAWQVLNDVDGYIAGRADIRPDVVRKAVAERQALMDQLATDGADTGAFTPGMRTGDYIQRRFEGDYFEDLAPPEFARGSLPSATKARTEALKTKEGLLKFLQDTPDADLDFNAMNVDARRAVQQGQLVQKAQLGRAVTGKKDWALTNPDDRSAMEAAINELRKDPAQADYAYKLENLYKGIPPRGDNWWAKGLHGANKVFKKAATAGILLPRIGFNVRNRMSNMWQVLSDEQARGTIGKNASRALSDLFGAFDDGFIKLTGGAKGRWSGDQMSKALDHIDQSMKAAQGSTAKFRELLAKHPDGALMQEALDNGVLENFISAEELLSRMAKTPLKQRVDDILNWPAAVTQGLEQRMRLGTFFDLRRGGIAKDGADAAQSVRGSALDYGVPGAENRLFRDFVPFGAFLSQNLRQQGKFIARHPVALTASAPLFGDEEGLPKYPWQERMASIPFGLDEEGNAQYLGLGGTLPIEGLNAVPGLSQEGLYSGLLSPLQPFLKTGLAYAADKDPFTGRSFGEYDKILGEPMGALGRAYNVIKSTGLTQPVTGPVDQVANLLDDRKSMGERLAQNLTGARFTSVDPDVAKRQRIEAFLDAHPEAKRYSGYYAEGENPELSDLLKQLNESKARLKAKREAAAGVL